jgi:hypothetical protein
MHYRYSQMRPLHVSMENRLAIRTYRHKRILDHQNTNSEKFDVPLLSPYMGQSRMLQYQRAQKNNVHYLFSHASSPERTDLRVGFAFTPEPPNPSY